ncbi:MAG: nuclear transport factor 2 family protein [Rhizobacter sp.]|nr:nuclear transport factor 2 family protein [Ferruginibacter sp.]
MTNEQLIPFFQAVEGAFSKAIVSNDTRKIDKFTADDWVLIDAQGGIISKQSFFSVVENGQLTHATMTKEVLRVKVYNDVALVTTRGQNTGTWQSVPMQADEWVTDVYRKQHEQWICVLTHLTPVKLPG